MKLFLLSLLAVMMLVSTVSAQDYSRASLLFGLYNDIDSKESGYQNWSTFVGASIPISGRFYGIVSGELADNDIGKKEYAFSPMVLAYLSEEDISLFGSVKFNSFLLLGQNVTWTDIQQTDAINEVTYLLTATGFGVTLVVGPEMKLWGAYQVIENKDYSTTRVGVGARWSLF